MLFFSTTEQYTWLLIILAIKYKPTGFFLYHLKW